MRYLENKKSKRELFCGTRACNGKHIINFLVLQIVNDLGTKTHSNKLRMDHVKHLVPNTFTLRTTWPTKGEIKSPIFGLLQ